MAYIRKRGNRWSITVEGPRDPVTNERTQISRSFNTEAEAKRAALKLEQEIEAGKQARCPTFEVFAKMYFETQVKSQVTDSTYINQWHYMEKYIIPKIGKKLLDKITAFDVEAFFTKLLREGVSRGTIKNIGLVLKKTFRAAQVWGFITQNVILLVKMPTYKAPTMKVWTAEQSKVFLGSTRGTAFHIAYVLALSTGMRIGEILALTWEDIDFENLTITITKSLKYDLVNRLHVKETKTTNSDRTIDIPQSTATELREHKEQQLTGLEMVVNWLDKHPYPSDVSREFRSRVKELGLPMIRFHDMRHTHATMMLKMGIHIKVVSERLGHANINTTLSTYSHVLPGMQREAAEKLNSIFM